MQLKILYEDNHIIAVEKQAGILSQRDFRDEDSLFDIVKNYIKTTYNKPGNVFLGLVHRLDRPVSGAIVFAKTSKAASRLHSIFKDRKIVKLYLALVPFSQSLVSLGTEWSSLQQKIIRNGDHSYIITDNNPAAQPVNLQYKTIFSNEEYCLLLIRLITGKKHQIRAQLSHIMTPIIGDKKYGSMETLTKNAIALHAAYLRFKHPVKDEIINIKAALPDYILRKIHVSQNTLDEIIKLDIKYLQI